MLATDFLVDNYTCLKLCSCSMFFSSLTFKRFEFQKKEVGQGTELVGLKNLD